MFRASFALRTFMAGTRHGAAAAAAAAGGSALSVIPAHPDKDSGDDPGQDQRDDDRSRVFRECLYHISTFRVSFVASRYFLKNSIQIIAPSTARAAVRPITFTLPVNSRPN